MKTFNVSGEGLYQHEVGNKDCQVGWCGVDDHPLPCKCGGLIHVDFGDEDYDGDYWLCRKCDKCGNDYEYAEEKGEK